MQRAGHQQAGQSDHCTRATTSQVDSIFPVRKFQPTKISNKAWNILFQLQKCTLQGNQASKLSVHGIIFLSLEFRRTGHGAPAVFFPMATIKYSTMVQ